MTFQTPEKGPRAATLQVRAWDASTGKEILARRLDLDVGEVGQHALTADGTALLGFTPDDKLRLRIWDLAKGGEIATLDALAADPSIERAMGHFMALSTDRKTLVWQMLATTLVWDVRDQENPAQALSVRIPGTSAVAISPDGKLVACHRGGPPHVVQLWDWSAGKQVAELQGFAGHLSAWRSRRTASCSRRATNSERFASLMLQPTRRSHRSRDMEGPFVRLSSRRTGVGCTRRVSTVRSGAGSPFPIRTLIRSTEMQIFIQ